MCKTICLNMMCPSYKTCNDSAHNNLSKKDMQSYINYDYRDCILNIKKEIKEDEKTS